jgi:lipopolysaccharide transport system ATP-binding protein
MPQPVIKVENLSKLYRLGLVGTGTMAHDLNRWWKMNIMHQPDPYAKIGETNDRSHKGSSEFVWALKDINFEVQQGEVLGIIGRNGAGKSTLLKILSQVTTPTTGNIKVKGRIASLLEVGTGFHPELTGRENVYMNGTIMGMKKREIDAKFDEIIDFAGVERYIDTPVKRYSSGMMVRLGFSVAAHLEPEILIVDEVLAVGDAEFQKKAMGKMQNVSHEHGRTVLFVSHNLGAIRTLCNKGIVLENGNISFEGLAEDSITNYLKKNVENGKSSIIDDIKYNTQKISIEKITVNNSPNRFVKINSNSHTLDFYVKGFAKESVKLALELKIFDSNDLPLAIYSPNHESGITRTYPKGSFELIEKLQFPKELSKGRFYADIYITNPLVEGYVEFERSLIIDSEGYPTKTGFIFDYSKGHGLLFLH